MHTTFLEKVNNPDLVRPFIESEKNKKSRQELFYEPTDNKTADHYDNHHNDIQKDLCKVVVDVQEHIPKKVNHGNNLIRCL